MIWSSRGLKPHEQQEQDGDLMDDDDDNEYADFNVVWELITICEAKIQVGTIMF